MKIHSELVNFSEDLPYLVRIFDDVNFDYPVHYHPDEYEITYTEGCRGTLIAGDSMTTFKDPDLVLTGPGLPHSWYDVTDSKNDTGRRVTVIHFTYKIFPEHWLDAEEFSSVKKLLNESLKGIQFKTSTAKELRKEFHTLEQGQGFKNFSIIVQILARLSKEKRIKILSDASLSLHDAKEEEERFKNVHEYIINNFRKKLYIREVAELAGLSESAFSHYFKKHSLKSFSDFVIDLRLYYARELLRNTSTSITSIAYESGFNSISNFNRLFRERSGMTPGDFRNKHKKK